MRYEREFAEIPIYQELDEQAVRQCELMNRQAKNYHLVADHIAGDSHLFALMCEMKHHPRVCYEVANHARHLPEHHRDFLTLSVGGQSSPAGALPLHIMAQTPNLGFDTLQQKRDFYYNVAMRSRKGLDVMNSAGKTALMIACAQGNVDAAEALLRAGAGSYLVVVVAAAAEAAAG